MFVGFSFDFSALADQQQNHVPRYQMLDANPSVFDHAYSVFRAWTAPNISTFDLVFSSAITGDGQQLPATLIGLGNCALILNYVLLHGD